MQGYMESNRLSIKIVIFFLLITFIAYLPFTSFLFALKNDAFTGYFPPKFFMSESIHAGYLPLWNPYINYGLPQYGDMSSGFWSPITWLVASTVGYSAYTFTLEEAFYIFMAGLGMYHLTSYWGLKNKTRLIAGVVYMCCGYMVGHLQHFNWISGAAFLPWCLFTYLQVIKSTNAFNLLKSALAFSLFFSSAHPGLIISGIYFFILVSAALFLNKIMNGGSLIKIIGEMCFKHLYILVSILLFIIGPIIGYLEVLPHISRADKLSIDSIAEPASLQTWLSVILPLSITKNDTFYATDISMRNSYFGLLFLLLFLTGLAGKKTKWQQLFLVSGLFFFLLSIGGIFKNISFNYLPLIGYVRLSGEFRIYTIFSAILFSAIQFNKIDKENAWMKLRPGYYFLLVILGSTLLFSLYHVFFTNQSIFFNNIITGEEWRLSLKQIVDHLTFYDTLLFQSTLQIFILILIYYALRRGRKTALFYAAIVEIIIASLLNLPFTGIGKASPSEVQHILNSSPRGIPIPPLQPTSDNDTIAPDQTKLAGDWSFYSKQIGAINQVSYPIKLKNTVSFFNQSSLGEINKKEFIYVSNQNGEKQHINILKFSPILISLELNIPSSTNLVIKQNYYPRWICTINNREAPIFLANNTFMGIQAEEGKSNIVFQFKNKNIELLIYVNLALFTLGLILLIVHFMRQKT